MKITIEVAKENSKWKKYSSLNITLMKKVVANIIQRFDNLRKIREVHLSILLTDDAKMLSLNHEFLGKNKATNVLSFPDVELNSEQLLEFKPNLDYMYLGDIAFGYQIIQNEASFQNKKFEHHFIHLLVHSMLHLLGFDHENDRDANIMESLEIEILKDFSILPPY